MPEHLSNWSSKASHSLLIVTTVDSVFESVGESWEDYPFSVALVEKILSPYWKFDIHIQFVSGKLDEERLTYLVPREVKTLRVNALGWRRTWALWSKDNFLVFTSNGVGWSNESIGFLENYHFRSQWASSSRVQRTYLEIAPKTISKKTAFTKSLAHEYEFEMESVFAWDQLYDMTYFLWAGA